MYTTLPDTDDIAVPTSSRTCRRPCCLFVSLAAVGVTYICSAAVQQSNPIVGLPSSVIRFGTTPGSSPALLASAAWDKYGVFKYLRGWTQDRFVACTFHPPPCPESTFATPASGCSVQGPARRLLLTSDGLSSVHVQEAFRAMLRDAAESRGGATSKRVLLILDSAYAAYRDGLQSTAAYEYCAMRRREFGGLGASAVVCLILDPAARRQEWEAGQTDPRRAAFGNAMLEIDDDYISSQLGAATAVYAEVGSPIPLLAAMRRKLSSKSGAGPQLSFADAVRKRVLDGSGTFVYVGASSGSTIAGESVAFLQDRSAGLLGGDLSGLRLVPNCTFLPHVTAEQAPWLHQVAVGSGVGMMGIPDCYPVVAAARPGTPPQRLRYLCGRE